MEIVCKEIYESLIRQVNIVEDEQYFEYPAFHRLFDEDTGEIINCLVYDSLFKMDGNRDRNNVEPIGTVKDINIEANGYIARVKNGQLFRSI